MNIFKNFFFVLKRFKTSSVLNILGLSAAFAIFTVITIQSVYDATYNHCFEKANSIHSLRYYLVRNDDESFVLSMPFAKNIAEKVPEIENHTIIQRRGKLDLDLNVEGNSPVYSIEFTSVRDGFLDMFTPIILQGNAADIFSGNNKALISKKEADKLFGKENPIGKTIYYHHNKSPLEIVAIYKDFPKNSSLTNGIFINLPFNEDESEWSYETYIAYNPQLYETVVKKVNSDEVLGEGTRANFEQNPDKRVEIRTIPIKELYLREGNNKTTFISLIFIGIIILIIAYINYLNFTIAMTPSRVKAINIHKILGIQKSKLITTLLSEGVLLSLLSAVLALGIIYAFSSSTLSQFFTADLSLSENLPLIAFLVVLYVVLIIIVGIYPAQYGTSFHTAITLNGSFALSPKGVKLRNILLAIQFVAAISISAIAIYIKLQHDYMKNFATGIQKENIVYLPTQGIETDMYTFAAEMKRNSDIIDFTASEFIPGRIGMGWGRDFEGKSVNIMSWPVIPGFLDFFGIKVIAGSDFSDVRNDSTALEQVIVNQKFMDKYEFDNNIIGKNFPTFMGGILNGVAGDINFQSVHTPIEPMAFVVLNNKIRDQRIRYLFFKISGNNVPQTLDYMKQTWSKFSKEDFNLTFLDQHMNELYKKENDTAKLIGLFGLVTIVIAVMGVYGLIVFNTRYKRKEIAIRKVNGSSSSEVILMLNKGLLIILSISFILSIALAYLAIGKWAEQFPYKAPESWWIFALAGFIIALITFATVSWQSWRAATANPVESLKSE